MNAEEFLKGLNEHDSVFEIDTEYEYTEQQLITFAERYHEKKLKLLSIGVVSDCFKCNTIDCGISRGRICYKEKCEDYSGS